MDAGIVWGVVALVISAIVCLFWWSLCVIAKQGE